MTHTNRRTRVYRISFETDASICESILHSQTLETRIIYLLKIEKVTNNIYFLSMIEVFQKKRKNVKKKMKKNLRHHCARPFFLYFRSILQLYFAPIKNITYNRKMVEIITF